MSSKWYIDTDQGNQSSGSALIHSPSMNGLADRWTQWRSRLSNVQNTPFHNCYCNECGLGVIGVRYKCMICSRYDSCQGCVDKHSSTGHPMIRIISTSDNSWESFFFWFKMDEDTLSEAMDNCLVIKYLRDKQIQRMSSFENDEAKKFVKQMMDDFVGLVGDIKKLSNYRCDKCGRVIEGVRTKCISCNDYDLCQDCEKAQKHKDHAMIRIVNKNDYTWLLAWFFAKCPIEWAVQRLIDEKDTATGESSNNTHQENQPSTSNTDAAKGGEKPKNKRPRLPGLTADNIRCAISAVVGVGGIITNIATRL